MSTSAYLFVMWADRVIARLGFETDKGEKAA
jgi:hypothetical protein